MYDLDLLDDFAASDALSEPTEFDPHERLVTAALLAATAFRLKDPEGLVFALRKLVVAVGSYSGDVRHR